MKLVKIDCGIFRGKEISGVFKASSKGFKFESLKSKPKDGKFFVIDSTKKEFGIWVNEDNYSLFNGDSDKIISITKALRGENLSESVESEKEKLSDKILGEIIEKRFETMNRLTTGVIKGNIRSLVISGAAGVGKSFELVEKLEKAEFNREVKAVKINGVISGKGLYKLLYENNNKKSVIVLDDTDRVFSDEDAMNVLKSALDTSKKRTITWNVDSFAKDDIPSSFDFEGSIIFISNINFDQMVCSNGKMAPHIKALMSRSLYLDLAVHTHREIMIRIEQVVRTGDILSHTSLSKKEKTEIIEWFRKNYNKMRYLSLREILHVAALMESDKKNWKDDAEVTLFDPKHLFA